MHVCLLNPVGQKLLQGCATLDPDRVHSNADIWVLHQHKEDALSFEVPRNMVEQADWAGSYGKERDDNGRNPRILHEANPIWRSGFAET
jgi:hypothetical protein